MTPSSNTKLFISYSRSDGDKVEHLHRALSEAPDLRVFRDTDDILPTEEWKPRLEKLIRDADTILFALSPQSIASEVCAWELELAGQLNKRIIPVVVENVDGDVPPAVSKLNYIFLTEADDTPHALNHILDAVRLDIDWIREHTRLSELADRWEKSVRLGAQPLRGKELQAAESWLVEQPKAAPSPTQQQRQYIYASRQAATRRQRFAVTGAVAAMIVVGLLGAFAWIQRGAALEGERKAQAALRSSNDATQTIFFEVSKRLDDLLAPTDLRIDVLTSLQSLQSSLAENFPDDMLVQRSRAIALTDIAALQQSLGEPASFEKSLLMNREALAISQDLLAREPDNHIWKRDVLVSMRRIASDQRDLGRMDEALETFDQAISIAEDLVQTSGQVVHDRFELAQTIGLRSEIHLVTANAPSALEDAQTAKEMTKTLLAEDQFGSDAAILYSVTRKDAVEELLALHRHSYRARLALAQTKEEQEQALEELHQARQILLDERDRSGDPGFLLDEGISLDADYVRGMHKIGKGREVMSEMRAIVERRREQVALNPDNINLRSDLAVGLQNLALLEFGSKRDTAFKEALEHIDVVLSISPESVQARLVKAQILTADCDSRFGRKEWRKAIEICKQSIDAITPTIDGDIALPGRIALRDLDRLGILYMTVGERDNALPYFRKAMDVGFDSISRFPESEDTMFTLLGVLLSLISVDPENDKAYASGGAMMAKSAMDFWPNNQVFPQMLDVFEQTGKEP